jgi:hypothetical protein
VRRTGCGHDPPRRPRTWPGKFRADRDRVTWDRLLEESRVAREYPLVGIARPPSAGESPTPAGEVPSHRPALEWDEHTTRSYLSGQPRSAPGSAKETPARSSPRPTRVRSAVEMGKADHRPAMARRQERERVTVGELRQASWLHAACGDVMVRASGTRGSKRVASVASRPASRRREARPCCRQSRG